MKKLSKNKEKELKKIICQELFKEYYKKNNVKKYKFYNNFNIYDIGYLLNITYVEVMDVAYMLDVENMLPKDTLPLFVKAIVDDLYLDLYILERKNVKIDKALIKKIVDRFFKNPINYEKVVFRTNKIK